MARYMRIYVSNSFIHFFLFFFFFEGIFSNTLGGNSFSLMFMHVHTFTRHIHAFLLFDGLNLERVFDKRVKIAVYVVACVQHSCLDVVVEGQKMRKKRKKK
jgi:hypothetical protein